MKRQNVVEAQVQAISNLISKVNMAGLATLVAINMAVPSLAPKVKMISAGTAVIAGMLSKGCSDKQKPEEIDEENEERQKQLRELEQLIMDYVEMCCEQHSYHHHQEASQVSDTRSRPEFVRQVHYECITKFINNLVGDSVTLVGVGIIQQDEFGKVQSGRLTQFSITDLKPGEKVDNDIRRWSLINDTNERGRITDFAVKDEITQE